MCWGVLTLDVWLLGSLPLTFPAWQAAALTAYQEGRLLAFLVGPPSPSVADSRETLAFLPLLFLMCFAQIISALVTGSHSTGPHVPLTYPGHFF